MLQFKALNNSIDLVWSDIQIPWKCNGLIIKGDNRTILIDCNFSSDEIPQLLKRTNSHIESYIVSHMHIDHANNVHNWERYGIPIYCPNPEENYLLDFQNLLDASGSTSFGTNEIMKLFTYKIQGFKEPSSVNGFRSGTIWEFDNITIETIPLPGHSPGHTGFIIRNNKDLKEMSILFTSDIGLDAFGAWYGFNYCNLRVYRESIELIKKIYTGGDYILASSHNKPLFKKQDMAIFNAITAKMDETEKLLLNKINEKGQASLVDLVLTGIYYSLSSIGKMNELNKGLYRFWEYYTLKNHVEDLVSRGMVVINDSDIIEVAAPLKKL